jgi:hypothetical protein
VATFSCLLFDGRSGSRVMGWSSSVGSGGSVRSIRFSVGVWSVVCRFYRGCVCAFSLFLFCPESRVAISICICRTVSTIFVVFVVEVEVSSCSI